MALDFSGLKKAYGNTGSTTLNLNDPETVKYLSEQLNVKKEDKATLLDRLVAGLDFFGSGIDAALEAKRKGTGIIGGLGEYASNLGSNLGTAFLGKPREKRKYGSDLLKELGVKNKYVKGVGGFALDVLTDPLTYVSFGTASVAKNMARKGVKEVAEGVAKKGAKELLEGAGKKEALKFLGKELTTNPALVKGSKWLVNPLGETIGEGWKLGKNFEPSRKVLEGLEDMFKVNAKASREGLGEFVDKIDTIKRAEQGVVNISQNQLEYLKKGLNNLSDTQKDIWYEVFEGTLKKGSPEAIARKVNDAITPEFTKLVNKARTISKEVQDKLVDRGLVVTEGVSRLKKLIGTENLEAVSTETILQKIKSSGIKLSQGEKTALGRLKQMMGKRSEQLPLKAGRTPLIEKSVGEMSEFVTDLTNKMKIGDRRNATTLLSKLAQKEGDTGVLDAIRKFVEVSNIAKTTGGKPLKKSLIWQKGKSALKTEKQYLQDVADYIQMVAPEKGQAVLKQLEDAGIKAQSVPYMHRKVVGYTKEFLSDKFGGDMLKYWRTSSKYAKEVEKQLASKNGFMSEELLGRLFQEPQTKRMMSNIPDPQKALGDMIKARTFKTAEEAKKAGVLYSKEIGDTLVEQVAKSNAAIEVDDMLQELLKVTDDAGSQIFTPYKKGDVIPNGFEKITILGNKGTFIIPVEAKPFIERYTKEYLGDDGVGAVLKAFDQALGLWKGSVTQYSLTGFLGFNVRNAIGDITNMMLISGFNPLRKITYGGISKRPMELAYEVLDFQERIKKYGVDKAMEKVGKEKGKILQKLYEEGAKSGIMRTSRLATESGIEDQVFQMAGQRALGKELGGKATKVLDMMTARKVFEFRENWFRMANLLDSYRQFGDWAKAGKNARLGSLDYGALTNFEKNFMRRIMPFYSFFKKNLEGHLTSLPKNPGKYATHQKVFRALRNTFGDELTPEEEESIPDWMKEGVYIPMKGKEGRGINILTTTGDPLMSLAQLGSAGETIPSLLGSTNPILKALIEYSTGKNLFTGQDIVSTAGMAGQSYENLPDWTGIKQAVGYKEIERESKSGNIYKDITIDPMKAKVLGDTPVLGNIIAGLKRWANASKTAREKGLQDPATVAYLSQVFAGARIYERDLDQLLTIKEKKEIDELRDKLIMQERVGKEFTRFYIPQEDMDKLNTLLNQE